MRRSGGFFCRGQEHAERLQVGVEDEILFHPLLLVLFAQRNDLLQDLCVEALYPRTISMLLWALYARSIRRLGGFRFHSNARQTSALISLAQAGLQSNRKILRA